MWSVVLQQRDHPFVAVPKRSLAGGGDRKLPPAAFDGLADDDDDDGNDDALGSMDSIAAAETFRQMCAEYDLHGSADDDDGDPGRAEKVVFVVQPFLRERRGRRTDEVLAVAPCESAEFAASSLVVSEKSLRDPQLMLEESEALVRTLGWSVVDAAVVGWNVI